MTNQENATPGEEALVRKQMRVRRREMTPETATKGMGPGRTYSGLIACRNYPIVYGNMPKAACTTIKNLLYHIDTGEPYPDSLAIHADKNALLRASGEDAPDVLRAAIENRSVSFTFVRNPFKRAYSAFNEKVFQQSPYSFRWARRVLTQEYGAVFRAGLTGYTVERHSRNFRLFLQYASKNIKGETSEKSNNHWDTQTNILRRLEHTVRLDVIGKVERFADHMQDVLNRAAVTKVVDLSVRFNEGADPPFRYEEVLTPEIKDLLISIYEEDAVRFGYRLP